MGALVGGIIALILGLIGLIYWWGYFIKALMAIVPIGLILGGALATYLGIEEWKDTARRTEDEVSPDTTPDTAQAEKEKYKAEAEKYKAELDALKKPPESEKAED
ncbi:MAG: hypothetical protein JRI95_14235 [Deltaproteobacteria bacterium]|nr:hypothetical protein [Deltaproteobacteria bacterium]